MAEVGLFKQDNATLLIYCGLLDPSLIWREQNGKFYFQNRYGEYCCYVNFLFLKMMRILYEKETPYLYAYCLVWISKLLLKVKIL